MTTQSQGESQKRPFGTNPNDTRCVCPGCGAVRFYSKSKSKNIDPLMLCNSCVMIGNKRKRMTTVSGTVEVKGRQEGKTVDLAMRIAMDPRQVEQLLREHQNMTTLCGELKSKGVKQRQEIASLTRQVEQLRSDKANLLFDLNKERTKVRLLRAEQAENNN